MKKWENDLLNSGNSCLLWGQTILMKTPLPKQYYIDYIKEIESCGADISVINYYQIKISLPKSLKQKEKIYQLLLTNSYLKPEKVTIEDRIVHLSWQTV